MDYDAQSVPVSVMEAPSVVSSFPDHAYTPSRRRPSTARCPRRPRRRHLLVAEPTRERALVLPGQVRLPIGLLAPVGIIAGGVRGAALAIEDFTTLYYFLQKL